MHFPVTLQFKPSRRLRAALVFAHALSALCLLIGAPYWHYGLLGMLILAFSLTQCLRSIEVPPGLKLMQDGCLLWGDQPGRVLAGSVAFASLIVLRVRLEDEGPTRRLVVLRDSLAPTDYRQFQIWLRWVVPVKPAEGSV